MCYMDLKHTCYKDLIGYEFNGCLKNDYDANPFINAWPSHMDIVFVFLACRYTSLFKRGLRAHKIYHGSMIMVPLGGNMMILLQPLLPL
jgi:hypothetical protein